MNGTLLLRSPEARDLELRSAAPADLENLRLWKNAHRLSFFFQGLLTPQDQQRWYSGFRDRPDDYMFLLWVRETPVGCIGLRVLEGRLDIYNVIMGLPGMSGQGWMREALRLLCSFAAVGYPGAPIGVKVLRANPAVSWYRRQGFTVTRTLDDHVEMTLDPQALPTCAGLEMLAHSEAPMGGEPCDP